MCKSIHFKKNCHTYVKKKIIKYSSAYDLGAIKLTRSCNYGESDIYI